LRGYGELAEERMELMCAGAAAARVAPASTRRIEELAALRREDPLGDLVGSKLFRRAGGPGRRTPHAIERERLPCWAR